MTDKPKETQRHPEPDLGQKEAAQEKASDEKLNHLHDEQRRRAQRQKPDQKSKRPPSSG